MIGVLQAPLALALSSGLAAPAQPEATLLSPPPALYSPAPYSIGAPAAVADGGGWEFGYTWIEAGATRLDLDTIDDDADTYYGEVSLDLFNLIYVFGNYENVSTDFDNADSANIALGVGAHLDVLDRLDLFGDIAWLYSDFEGDTFNGSESGTHVRAGARWLPWQFGTGGLELAGNALWVSIDNPYLSDDESFGWEAEGRVHIIRNLSVGLAYRQVGDDTSGILNARLTF